MDTWFRVNTKLSRITEVQVKRRTKYTLTLIDGTIVRKTPDRGKGTVWYRRTVEQAQNVIIRWKKKQVNKAEVRLRQAKRYLDKSINMETK